MSSAMPFIESVSGNAIATMMRKVMMIVEMLRSFPLLSLEKKPKIKKIIIPTRMMAKKFVKNNKKLPLAISILVNINPMPVTQSGGTNAVAIATPARFSRNFLYPSERNAMIPLASAMNKSIKVGDILAVISGVSLARGVK